MTDFNPDYLAEYDRRYELSLRLREDEDYCDAYMDVCRLDPVRWINDWCITYNPRNQHPIPKILPFLLFPRQEQFIDFLMGCIRDRESGLIEKSRDIGATWLCCALSVWLWLFVPGAAVGWGSRKQDLVDRIGDPDSIFEKMRMIIDRLPAWMLPPSYDRREHLSSMKILNKDTGAVITGESGDQIGRGGRKMIYFKDEAAHYERPELIEAALGDNTDVQIDMSSVNGSANVFYRKRMAGEEWHPNTPSTKGKTRVFIFDWRDHPGKTQEWYDLRRRKWEDDGLLHIFAQEVDRDYSGSKQGIVIPQEWVRAAIDAHVKLKFIDNGERIAAQDVADGGHDKNALGIRYDRIMKWSDHWGGESGAAARYAIPIVNEHKCTELYYDSIGVGAGFKTEVNTMKSESTWNPRLKVFAWNAAAEVLDPDDPSIAGDSESTTNKVQYENLKAQAWFRLRSMFYKTYRAVTAGIYYPQNEMLSLDSTNPRLHQLCLELSQAIHKPSARGKTMIVKKDEGESSPNLADQCVMVFNPTRELTGFDVLDCHKK